MPALVFIPPMLATLVKTLPEGPGWEYEVKLDGYRLEAIKDGDKVRLYSRRGNDFTKKFARIATAVLKIKAASFVLDGEAVAVDKQGRPSFQMLQNRSSLPAGWSLPPSNPRAASWINSSAGANASWRAKNNRTPAEFDAPGRTTRFLSPR